jgi:hypothetical protein
MHPELENSIKWCDYFGFNLYFCLVLLKITYVSFLSTKVSEIFDMTNSWVTFVAQVILNIIF